jgi:hypothetical protein
MILKPLLKYTKMPQWVDSLKKCKYPPKNTTFKPQAIFGKFLEKIFEFFEGNF